MKVGDIVLKIGDIVVLKSGGPPMTIGEIVERNARCVWFVDSSPMGDTFALDALTLLGSEDSLQCMRQLANALRQNEAVVREFSGRR